MVRVAPAIVQLAFSYYARWGFDHLVRRYSGGSRRFWFLACSHSRGEIRDLRSDGKLHAV